MAIITLTTDFGVGSPYVAAVKGVLLSVNPAVRLVDISHDVEPQNVRQAALLMAEATPWFPPGSMHIGVIDPGVGTTRRIVYARIGDQDYLAPDNGLLSLLAKRKQPGRMVHLTNSTYWRPEVSSTFHGRDIFAPVAARLSMGLAAEQLGPSIDDLQILDWPEPRRVGNCIEGRVEWIDRFGNAITNISGTMLPQEFEHLHVKCAGRVIVGLAASYGHCPSGQLMALVGSSGNLEIAVVNGSAMELLQIKNGTPLSVQW